MSKLGKTIGAVCAGALAAALIPYRFERDRDTGAREVSALLWKWKKIPGKGIYFSMPPSGMGKVSGEDAEAPAEDAEASAEDVEVTAEDAPAEPKQE